jgi:hypothetical protein
LAKHSKVNIALLRPASIVSQAHAGDTHSANLAHQYSLPTFAFPQLEQAAVRATNGHMVIPSVESFDATDNFFWIRSQVSASTSGAQECYGDIGAHTIETFEGKNLEDHGATFHESCAR